MDNKKFKDKMKCEVDYISLENCGIEQIGGIKELQY